MRRFVDLHTHSTASDGTLTPEELIRQAEARQLAAVALTDHDTTAGLRRAHLAARQCPALRFVPGVEVSARSARGTLHILGLGIDETAEPLARLLCQLRQARAERNPRILAKLQALGLAIDMDDVRGAGGQDACGPAVIGRLHIAEALRRRACVRSVQDAFAKYLRDGGPAYVDKERLAPGQVIDAIVASGGLAVLAHPAQLQCDNRAQLERIVRELLAQGLEGLEVYHSDHNPAQTREFLDLAGRLGLCVTGGSDFHGSPKPQATLGRPRVPLSMITGRLADWLRPPARPGRQS